MQYNNKCIDNCFENVIFYDLETTGLDVNNDLIIEISGYHEQKNIMFNSFINIYPNSIPKESTKIHNISDKDLIDAPKGKETLIKFCEFCGENALLIAHNNDKFDKLMLESNLKKIGLEVTNWIYLDTLKWFKEVTNSKVSGQSSHKSYRLDALKEYFEIPCSISHRASDDTKTLYKIFTYFKGNLSYREIFEYVYILQKANKNF